MTTKSNRIQINYLEKDFTISELTNKAWLRATDILINHYWSGTSAPPGRQFTAKLLWSDAALYIRFTANQTEPLIVSDNPDRSKKTLGLWNRDVCEIFIAPDKNKRNKYFEFEIAPTGEWVDLGIEITANGRLTDQEYMSGTESSAQIQSDKIVMAIKIPFSSLGKAPKTDDIWLGNLFRCVGSGPTRGYLAWQPTKTREPAFHVPEAFGEFWFVNDTSKLA